MGKSLLTIRLENNRFARNLYNLLHIPGSLVINQKLFPFANFTLGNPKNLFTKNVQIRTSTEWFLLGLDTYYCIKQMTLGTNPSSWGNRFIYSERRNQESK